MSAPSGGTTVPSNDAKISTVFNPANNTYFPFYQIIGNTTLTGTGNWYSGLSSTPNTTVSSPVTNVITVPTAFTTRTTSGFISPQYFMYSANTSTANRRARTVTITYRFTNSLTQTQDITMNIPANQMVRIGIPAAVFTINYDTINSTVTQTVVPAFGTLQDLFQETI